MAGGNLVEEELHALAVDAGQNQGIQLTVGHRDRRIGVRVFLHDHGLAQGPNGLGAPTAPGIRDAPEANLVLKHQPDGSFTEPRLVDFREDVGEFFFQCSCAATLALGCCLSGTSLRQP